MGAGRTAKSRHPRYSDAGLMQRRRRRMAHQALPQHPGCGTWRESLEYRRPEPDRSQSKREHSRRGRLLARSRGLGDQHLHRGEGVAADRLTGDEAGPDTWSISNFGGIMALTRLAGASALGFVAIVLSTN